MACPSSADAEQSADGAAWAEAARYVGIQVVHPVVQRHLAAADDLDPPVELPVAQSLWQMKRLARSDAAEVKEAPNDDAQ